jgi:hypothetical protein
VPWDVKIAYATSFVFQEQVKPVKKLRRSRGAQVGTDEVDRQHAGVVSTAGCQVESTCLLDLVTERLVVTARVRRNEDRLTVRGSFDHMRDDASHIVSCTTAECLTDESLDAIIRVAR